MCVQVCFDLFPPATLEKITCPFKPQSQQYNKGIGVDQLLSKNGLVASEGSQDGFRQSSWSKLFS